MEDDSRNNIMNSHNDDINFYELFQVLLDGKWIILSVTAFISIAAVIYSLSLPDIYKSEALLVPVEGKDSFASGLQGYSSLASFAGISLPANAGDSNAAKSIEKLKSLSFFENNILPNINLQELMALRSWNSLNNTLEFDKTIFDSETNSWLTEDYSEEAQIPSIQMSFKRFKEQHLDIMQDSKTGFITLSIKHKSPFIAQKWNALLVDEINSYYRTKDKVEAEKAISFLNDQIASTSLTQIKQVLAELLQKETEKLTLTEANELYVFDYIDPASVMEEKSEPQRALICVLYAVFGFMISIIIVFIKYYRSDTKNS
jgi:LPS O-antigen subunit length determinant protein (WzzB/FepE family)